MGLAADKNQSIQHYETDLDLVRFIDAQKPVYRQVVQELAAGHKATHWMWFIFPQLAGLGHSPMAIRFAIANLDQAGRYLKIPTLGERLRECTRLMVSHEGRSALSVLGSPDDLKFRSCMTLFLEAALDKDDRALFRTAIERFYGGMADLKTLELLWCR